MACVEPSRRRQRGRRQHLRDLLLELHAPDLVALGRVLAVPRAVLVGDALLDLERGPGRVLSQLEVEVYSGHLKLNGEEAEETFIEALNYSSSLVDLKRFEVAKALLRKTMPVARRVLGPEHRLAFKMRWVYARALYEDDRATLDNLREAVATLEETERTARRVLGGAHPATEGIEFHLRDARAARRARENAATGDPD